MKKNHLTLEERYQIQIHHDRGKSRSWIAVALGRSHTTVTRELERNSTAHGYKAEQAQRMYENRRAYANGQRRKLVGALLDVVIARLRAYDSPEQISGWLKRAKATLVSHETIYQLVYGRLGRKLNLKACLRHGGRKYQRRDKRKYAGRGYIKDRVDIDQRPPIVDQKIRIGDWELDTIVGAGHQGYIVSMVERFSKYTKLVLVPDCKAKTVKNAICKALKQHRNQVHTLTSDNGKEFSKHVLIAKNLMASFFFAKPYHSWERGLNEHTNGLVRQFLPKKTNFLNLSEDLVNWIENNLNNRPRKVLNFYSPLEVFSHPSLLEHCASRS